MNLEKRKSELVERIRKVEILIDTVGHSIHEAYEKRDEIATKAVIDPSEENVDARNALDDTISELQLREYQRKQELKELNEGVAEIARQLEAAAKTQTAAKQVALQKLIPSEWPKAELALQKAFARYAHLRAIKTGKSLMRQDYTAMAIEITKGDNLATFSNAMHEAGQILDEELDYE